MKFSFVVPVYNVKDYIAECVQSMLNQTYDQFEIILIDDGSTDGSGDICDDFAKHFPEKVKVFHTPNRGQLYARSGGIEKSTGDVLLFIDSDDCIRNDALKRLAECFEKTKSDMVFFNASTSSDYSTADAVFPFDDGTVFQGEAKRILYEMMITTSKLNPLWLKAVKREVTLSVPENYVTFGLSNAGDFLYAIPMLSRAEKITYMNETLYYYRQREGSIVHTYNPKRHQSIKKVHLEMEKYIDLWGMQELHPRHFAREVRGWLQCLRLTMISDETKKANRDAIMRELARDDYFRKAYEKMDREAVGKADRLLAFLLYHEKYAMIHLLGKLLKMQQTMKRCIG